MADMSVCDCGEPWELPCRCPERLIEEFTVYNKYHVFYYTNFADWMLERFGELDQGLINDCLNLEGIIELGDSAYQSPFEV